jgi:hypothetical protein
MQPMDLLKWNLAGKIEEESVWKQGHVCGYRRRGKKFS